MLAKNKQIISIILIMLGIGIITWALLTSSTSLKQQEESVSVDATSEEHNQTPTNEPQVIEAEEESDKKEKDEPKPKPDTTAKQPAPEAPTEKPIEKPKPKPKPKPQVTRGTMNLSVDPSTMTYAWSYTGKAPYGYRLVWSTDESGNTNPTLGAAGTTAVPLMLIGSSKTGAIPEIVSLEPGKTYYVTICAFTKGAQIEPCVDYAPVIQIDL